MTADAAMMLATTALEAAIVLQLVSRRIYRMLPVFFAYQIWCLCSSLAAAIVLDFFLRDYIRFYFLNITGDALFQLAVLAELWRVVVRHNRVRPPGRAIVVLLLMLAFFFIFSIAKWTVPGNISGLLLLSMRLRQVFGVLQFAGLLALVWFTNFWGLRWPGRALQVATGLGFYFLIDLAVIVMHTHESYGTEFLLFEKLASFSYFGVLGYWVFCFARSERDRREATD